MSGNLRKHLEQFIRLTDDEFTFIASHFRTLALKRNDFLVRRGQPVPDTQFVITGITTSIYTDETGKEHIMQFARENCWVTDQDAFYNRGKAIFDIICAEDCTFLALSFDDREKLCASMHKMERFFRVKANDSFIKQQKRLLTYLTADAQKRYDLLTEELPDVVQRLPKKILAAYLGVARETLSRRKLRSKN